MGARHIGAIVVAERLQHHTLLVPDAREEQRAEADEARQPAIQFGSSRACEIAHSQNEEYIGWRKPLINSARDQGVPFANSRA